MKNPQGNQEHKGNVPRETEKSTKGESQEKQKRTHRKNPKKTAPRDNDLKGMDQAT